MRIKFFVDQKLYARTFGIAFKPIKNTPKLKRIKGFPLDGTKEPEIWMKILSLHISFVPSILCLNIFKGY